MCLPLFWDGSTSSPVFADERNWERGPNCVSRACRLACSGRKWRRGRGLLRWWFCLVELGHSKKESAEIFRSLSTCRRVLGFGCFWEYLEWLLVLTLWGCSIFYVLCWGLLKPTAIPRQLTCGWPAGFALRIWMCSSCVQGGPWRGCLDHRSWLMTFSIFEAQPARWQQFMGQTCSPAQVFQKARPNALVVREPPMLHSKMAEPPFFPNATCWVDRGVCPKRSAFLMISTMFIMNVFRCLHGTVCKNMLWWQRRFQDHISFCSNRNILLLLLFIFNFIIDSTSFKKVMLKTTLTGDWASRSSSISAVLSHLSCIHHECIWMFTWYCVPKYAFRCKA